MFGSRGSGSNHVPRPWSFPGQIWLASLSPCGLTIARDLPVLVLRLDNYTTLSSLPQTVRDKLASVEDSLAGIGAISLQLTPGGSPDFYAIDSAYMGQHYREKEIDEVARKNPQQHEAARHYFQGELAPGRLKTTLVYMISTAALCSQQLHVRAPWGALQTQPAGVDAWIAKESEEAFYMVSCDPFANPIGYLTLHSC